MVRSCSSIRLRAFLVAYMERFTCFVRVCVLALVGKKGEYQRVHPVMRARTATCVFVRSEMMTPLVLFVDVHNYGV